MREGSSYTDKNLVAGSDSGIYSPSVPQRQPTKQMGGVVCGSSMDQISVKYKDTKP